MSSSVRILVDRNRNVKLKQPWAENASAIKGMNDRVRRSFMQMNQYGLPMRSLFLRLALGRVFWRCGFRRQQGLKMNLDRIGQRVQVVSAFEQAH